VQDVKISFESKMVGRCKPFTTQLAGTTATISGSNGFDQTIDYTVGFAIPKSKIPASAANDSALASNNLIGTSIQLPDPIKVNVLIGGTIKQPTIKTDFSNRAVNCLHREEKK
jgi:hypothetical protein